MNASCEGTVLAHGLHQRESKLPMIKYLNSRDCPNCHSTVTIMRLRYSSQLSTINGVCGNCDYSIKWLILDGNNAKPRTIKPTSAARIVGSGSDNEREVLRS